MFGAAFGPRVLPGIYTVKMTKADKVYTTQLSVTLDPRATYTLDDRKAQFDLVVRLSALLNHMSWAVDAIIGVRDTASALAGNLPQTDPLKKQLEQTQDQFRVGEVTRTDVAQAEASYAQAIAMVA